MIRLTPQRVLSLVAGMALLAVACDCGRTPAVGSDGGSPEVADVRSWCERPDGPYEGQRALYASMCDAMERCALTGKLGYAFGCRQECVQTFDFTTSCGLSEATRAAPFDRSLVKRQVRYDDAQGATCAQWYASSACGEIEQALGTVELGDSDSSASPVPEACQHALTIVDPSEGSLPGTVSQGGACSRTEECQEGLRCQAPASDGGLTLCSVCAPLPGAGEPCADFKCGAGAYCDSSQSPARCEVRRTDGSSCTQASQCTSDRCYSSSCITPLAEGASCSDSPECASLLCDRGTCTRYREVGEACDADSICKTGRCLAAVCIRPREAGEPCGQLGECRYSCYRGACIDPRRSGEACDEDGHCRSSLVCYQSKCVNKGSMPDGAPCTATGVYCASGLCLAGVCTAHRANGEACGTEEECASRVCFQGGCGYPDGQACYLASQCRSGRCPNHGNCMTALNDGSPCQYEEECASSACVSGACFTRLLLGASCTLSAQCQGGLYCEAGSGTCTVRVPNGSACTVNDACQREYCESATGRCGHTAGFTCVADWQCAGYCNGTCSEKKSAGSACTVDKECLGYCVSSRCVTLKPFGATCSALEECAGGLCDWDDNRSRCRGPSQCLNSENCAATQYCDSLTNTCAARKASGQSCGEAEECIDYCYDRRCVEKKPLGASCRNGAECSLGACDAGRCAAPGACSGDSDCVAPQFCDYSRSPLVCTSPRGNGSECEEDRECNSGWCSPATSTCKVQPQIGDPCRAYECTPGAFCQNGQCAPRRGPGESCSGANTDLECRVPYLCRSGRCEIMPLQCAPAPVGSACTMLMVCTPDAYCDLLDQFTCKPRAPVGTSCTAPPSPRIPGSCALGSHCRQGTCAPFAAAGGSCAAQSCDPTQAFCDAAGSCRQLKSAGAGCTEDSECLSDTCMGDDRCDGACLMP